MGIWIELGIFLLAFVFAAWQFHDLKKAKAERLARERAQAQAQAQAEAKLTDDALADPAAGAGSARSIPRDP